MSKKYSDYESFKNADEPEQLDTCFQAAANLYGLVPLRDLTGVIKKMTGREYTADQLEKLAKEMDESHERYAVEDVRIHKGKKAPCLVHASLNQNETQMQALARKQKDKKLYVPEPQEFVACQDIEYIYPNWIFDAQIAQLSRMLMESEDVIKDRFLKNAVLYKQDRIDQADFVQDMVSNPETTPRFVNILNLLIDMLDGIPLWSERGGSKENREVPDPVLNLVEDSVFEMEKPEETAAALADKGLTTLLSRRAAKWVRAYDDVARPVMRRAFVEKLERIQNGETGEVESEILFPLFYLTEMHDNGVFEPFAQYFEQVNKDASLFNILAGDFETNILYQTYLDNLETAARIIKNLENSRYVRMTMMEVVAQKCADGKVSKEDFCELLEPWISEETAADEDYVLFETAVYFIMMLNLKPLYKKARDLLEMYPDPSETVTVEELDEAMENPIQNPCILIGDDDNLQMPVGLVEAELELLDTMHDQIDNELFSSESDEEAGPAEDRPDQENEKQRARNKKAKSKDSRKKAKKARKANRKK